MKFVMLSFLALVGLLLQSCIEGDEEIWIEKDGSARLTAVYKIPPMLLSAEESRDLQKQVEEAMAADPALTLLKNDVTLVEGKRVVSIDLETTDVRRLEALMDGRGKGDSKAAKMLSALLGNLNIEVEKLSAGVSREVDLKPLLDDHLGNKPPSLLGDSEFRYTVHLPVASSVSNAHEVSDGGKTLKWGFRLAEHARTPMVLTVKAPLPIPVWVYVVVGLVGVLLMWGIVFGVRKCLCHFLS